VPAPPVEPPAQAPREVPLVLAHGFTQSAASWGAFGTLLRETGVPGRRVVAVDLAGHGTRSTTHADLVLAADLLLHDAAAALDADREVDLLGYSLGARIALRAALDHPDQVRSLVLLSGTAGIDDPAARARRRSADEARADALERSGDLEGFLVQWLAQPMFAHLDAGSDQLAARLVNTPDGLASSLRLAGTGAQDPLWDRLGELQCPTLALAGANDVRFARTARRLATGASNGCWSLVPGAGHALHLEQPTLTARIVAHWTHAVEPGRAIR